MYRIGDKVIYGSHGVCCVVGEEERTIDKRKVTYLALEPMGQGGSRFLVPTHNPVAMGKLCHVLTRQELDVLLHSEEIRKNAWIRDENLRKQTYRELIGSGDRQRMLSMIYTLYQHRASQAEAGKKVHLCDDNFLRDAEKLLLSEIAMVMELTPEQAKQYLRESLT